jgi:hypothetical protein
VGVVCKSCARTFYYSLAFVLTKLQPVAKIDHCEKIQGVLGTGQGAAPPSDESEEPALDDEGAQEGLTEESSGLLKMYRPCCQWMFQCFGCERPPGLLCNRVQIHVF